MNNLQQNATTYKAHRARRNEYVSSAAKLDQHRSRLCQQQEGLYHMWYHTSHKAPALMPDLSVRIRRERQRVSLEG